MAPQIVTNFEKEFLPCLEDYAQQLRQRFPRFSMKVCAVSLKGMDGHSLFLDFWREGSEGDEPNCISLEIGIRNLGGETVLCNLGICWGADGIPPRDSLDCLGEPVPWGPVALGKIRSDLPKLQRDLEQCLGAWEATYLK